MLRVQAIAADLGGCGHYRVIWPAMAANYAGLADVDVIDPDDGRSNIECVADLAATVDRYPGALAAIAAGTFDPADIVLGDLADVPDVDVVVLQRPLTDRLVDVIGMYQRHGIAVVVEVDDDFETIHPQNIAWRTVHPATSPRRNYRHLRRACELADLVVVTTPALAARYGRHGRVRVVPNYVPANYLRLLPADDHDLVRVGWSGSIDTHPNDLQVTRGRVADVLAARGLPFHLIGDHDPRAARALGLHPDTKLAHTGGWLPLEKYPVAMAMLDVGIVPLDLTPFNHAKSWLKGLEFAAVGVPFVASPTAPYVDLAARGIGELAERPNDWRRLVGRLVDDADHRADLAQRYRQLAARYVIEEHVDEHVDAWQAAADHAARRRRVSA